MKPSLQYRVLLSLIVNPICLKAMATFDPSPSIETACFASMLNAPPSAHNDLAVAHFSDSAYLLPVRLKTSHALSLFIQEQPLSVIDQPAGSIRECGIGQSSLQGGQQPGGTGQPGQHSGSERRDSTHPTGHDRQTSSGAGGGGRRPGGSSTRERVEDSYIDEDDQIRRIIDTLLEEFLSQLDLTTLIPVLISNGTINIDITQALLNTALTRKERNATFLNYLRTLHRVHPERRVYSRFHQALQSESQHLGHPNLAESITSHLARRRQPERGTRIRSRSQPGASTPQSDLARLYQPPPYNAQRSDIYQPREAPPPDYRQVCKQDNAREKEAVRSNFVVLCNLINPWLIIPYLLRARAIKMDQVEVLLNRSVSEAGSSISGNLLIYLDRSPRHASLLYHALLQTSEDDANHATLATMLLTAMGGIVAPDSYQSLPEGMEIYAIFPLIVEFLDLEAVVAHPQAGHLLSASQIELLHLQNQLNPRKARLRLITFLKRIQGGFEALIRIIRDSESSTNQQIVDRAPAGFFWQ